MRGVILAAGIGRRLAPMGWAEPKCLLQFDGVALLDNIVLSLTAHGITELTIVLGYKRELVQQQMQRHKVRWTTVFNEEYATTNTIHSLWLARGSLNDDFIYFNADVLFDRRIVSLLLGYPQTALAIHPKRCGKEEVKVVVDDAGRIRQIGKAIDPAACMGEFIGIGKFARAVCPALLDSLQRYNRRSDQKNLFFEGAVNDILSQEVFLAAPIDPFRAVEIDTPADYEAARNLVAEGQMGPRDRPS